MTPHYKFKYGETISIGLVKDNPEGLIVTTISSKIKKAGPNGTVIATNPIVATFTIVTTLSGYSFTTNTVLPVGYYVMDAKLTFAGGDSMITDTLIIQIDSSIS